MIFGTTTQLVLVLSCSFAVGPSAHASPCTCAPPPETVTQTGPTTRFTNYPIVNLRAVKEAYRAGDAEYRKAVDRVVDAATGELEGPIYTIVHKEILPPSGNPNDYISLGPYWWPDPDKADGLPWIRRDGEVNPVTRGDQTDKSQQNAFVDAVEVLAYAAYFTGRDEYRERAAELIDAFLIDPETKMNPHLEYAQGIPGINSGRCFGIIELVDVIDLVTGLEVLKLAGGVDRKIEAGADAWLSDYAGWLQTSELGIEEKTRLNNHGTWYDAQVLSILIHLGREGEARQIAEAARGRIDTQIEADGAQPHELARTKTLSYSTMNLKAFTAVAYLAGRVGVDLWNHTSPDGGSIPQAYAFLQPYAEGEAEWTRPQLGGADKVIGATRQLFVRAGSLFGVEEYCALSSELAGPPDLERLLYPCEP